MRENGVGEKRNSRKVLEKASLEVLQVGAA